MDSDSGNIKFARCTYEAQADQRCSHIACLLYLIEDLSLGQEPKIQQPGTSQQQAWGKGKRTDLDPVPVFERTYSKKQEQDRYVVNIAEWLTGFPHHLSAFLDCEMY